MGWEGAAVRGEGNGSKLRREDFIERARALVPELRRRAAEAEAARAIPMATHRAFADAGLYRLFQPKRYGGHEMDIGLMVDVAAELGRGCGSSAWIFTNLAAQSWVNGMKDPRAQDECWGDNPEALACSAFPGKDAIIKIVDGGVVVSGTFSYSSGVDFAEWNNLQLFLRPEGKPPIHAFAQVARKDYEIVDDWFVTGLAATGSRSIMMQDVFIPDYRMARSTDMSGGPTPGSAVNPGSLYRLPFWGVGAKLFSGPALGIARGALELVEEEVGSRHSVGGAKLWEQPGVHLRVAEAGGEIEAAWALLRRDCDEATRLVEQGTETPVLLRAFWRRNNSFAVVLCVRAVERIFNLAGLRGFAPDNAIQRCWRDVRAASAQVAMAWDTQAANYGRARFGLPLNDPRT
jgi:3-hydroxy-9,10-secoandrosta-1,3,5(10)-triene-9,17-dione monooxygenase